LRLGGSGRERCPGDHVATGDQRVVHVVDQGGDRDLIDGTSVIGSTASPVAGRGSVARMSCSAAAPSHTLLLLRRGRVDDVNKSGVHVVDHAGHRQACRKDLPGDLNIDPHGRVRVVDRLRLQLGHRDLEPCRQLVGKVGETTDAAVCVVQDHELAAGWATLTEPTQ
jgi:hypothetical protein